MIDRKPPEDYEGVATVPIDDEHRRPLIVTPSRVLLQRGGVTVEVALDERDRFENSDAPFDLWVSVHKTPGDFFVWLGTPKGASEIGCVDAEGRLYGAEWAIAPATFAASDLRDVDEDVIAQVAAAAIAKVGKTASKIDLVRAALRAYGDLLEKAE